MWEPVLAVGVAAASLVAIVQHLAARRSARALRGLRAENDSLQEEIRRTAGLGEFKARLEGSEGRFRAFMEHAPFEFLLKDAQGRYVEVNPAWENYFGLSSEEAFGKTPHDLFGGEFADSLSRRDWTVLETGRPLETEDRVPHPDGTTHIFHTTTFPLPGSDGNTVGLGMISADMTERRRAEQALRESEEQLRTIADNLPVMIVRWDREQRYTFVNRSAEIWYGRPASDIVGRTILELFGAGLPGRVQSAIEAGLSGQAVRFESSIEYPDGKSREVEIAYVPDFSCGGDVVGCFGLVQDVSERKAAERALRESEEQLRMVAENMPVLMTRFDRDGRYSFANRLACEVYACPVDGVVGRTIREIMGEENWQKIESRFRTAMAGQEVWFEECFRYPDGTERHAEVAYLPDFGADGGVRGAFALSHDVSDRKKLEAELLRNERLAVLGQLTGTVAHELRNPLGAVVMSLEVIRHGCESAGVDLDRALTRARRGLLRCETIVTELLDFARAKGLQRRPTILGSWLGGVLDEYDTPETVTIVRELRDAGAAALVDREELRRAVINVVDNACQAMTQDRTGSDNGTRPELAVTVRAPAARVEMEFADSGPGIREEILPQVMEPLFSTKPFGTGLGLPTVKRIMEEHGGGIELDSAQGGGTKVILWLPAEGSGDGDAAQ